MWKKVISQNGETKGMNDINNENNILSEAEELRRTWYQYVLNSLEKLDTRIDNISDELHRIKDDLRSEISACKSEVRKELENDYKSGQANIDRVEKRIEVSLVNMSKRIRAIEGSDTNEKLRKEIQEVTKDITKLKDDILSPLSIKMAKIETKVMMWGAIFGAVGSIVAAILMALVKTLMGRVN